MKNIKKSFGDKTALNDVSCSVYKSEIFGLLGPSGAGKTTIIKILTGQLLQTGGEASIFGTDTNKLTDEIYSQLGMVMENSGVYSRLSCYENLAIFAEIYNIKKNKIYEALEKVQLTEAAGRAVSKLSKGMLQRLIFARAIMHNPKILFLDEPTNGLDPATSMEIHKLIFELCDKGTTVFLTTHNMEEATRLCDNVALLNNGVFVEYGVPDSLCRKYNSQKSINIILKDGRKVIVPNAAESAKLISGYFSEDQVEAIHSSEPDLETVFLTLTGRKLV
jgi:ABC-2 type transport system ATP-binding protein